MTYIIKNVFFYLFFRACYVDCVRKKININHFKKPCADIYFWSRKVVVPSCATKDRSRMQISLWIKCQPSLPKLHFTR